MFGRKNIDFQSDYTSGSAPSQNTSPKCARWNSIGLSFFLSLSGCAARCQAFTRKPMSALSAVGRRARVSNGNRGPVTQNDRIEPKRTIGKTRRRKKGGTGETKHDWLSCTEGGASIESPNFLHGFSIYQNRYPHALWDVEKNSGAGGDLTIEVFKKNDYDESWMNRAVSSWGDVFTMNEMNYILHCFLLSHVVGKRHRFPGEYSKRYTLWEFHY